MSAEKALVFDIYRGTSHDGPGQRNTVFFKGCPLSCRWCHNPEGISPKRLVWWQSRLCIGCLLCHEACKTGANIPGENGIYIDRDKCIACGACAKACPAEAMTLCGEEWNLDHLVKEMAKYKPYYDVTGGGVTASGGEAMMQHDFIRPFFKALHQNGITTALDTCGFIKAEYYDEVLPFTDYILYDLKIFDAERHKYFCGQDNALILNNAKHIISSIASGEINAEFWIRTPLIPGATDDETNIGMIASFIVNDLGSCNISKWELCSFNNSCISKYDRLGKSWEFKGEKILTRSKINALMNTAVSAGFPKEKLFATGIINEEA